MHVAESIISVTPDLITQSQGVCPPEMIQQVPLPFHITPSSYLLPSISPHFLQFLCLMFSHPFSHIPLIRPCHEAALKSTYGSWERCELPQWVRTVKRFWCTLNRNKLKSSAMAWHCICGACTIVTLALPSPHRFLPHHR